MERSILQSSSSYYGNIGLLAAFIYFAEYYHSFFWVLWVVYALVPILDHFLPPSLYNPTAEEEKVLLNQKLRWVVPIYLFIAMCWITLFWSIDYVYRTPMTPFEFLCFGLILGNIGIICFEYDHELYHRKDKLARFVGSWDMLKSLYIHLYSSHVKGHHKLVATPMDMATGKKDQSFYAFLFPSLKQALVSAWETEGAAMAKQNKSVWNIENRMMWWLGAEFAFTSGIFYLYGLKCLIFFLFQAAVTVFILEEFNYFTHYGLQRKRLANGDYEPVNDKHAWSAHQFLENIIQLGVQRHPDHHANAYRPYQILRAVTDGPTLPCGYFMCVIIAAVPPVWFAMANPLLEGYTSEGKPNDKQHQRSNLVFNTWLTVQAAFVSALAFLV